MVINIQTILGTFLVRKQTFVKLYVSRMKVHGYMQTYTHTYTYIHKHINIGMYVYPYMYTHIYCYSWSWFKNTFVLIFHFKIYSSFSRNSCNATIIPVYQFQLSSYPSLAIEFTSRNLKIFLYMSVYILF